MQGACIVTAFAPKALFLLQALQKSQVGFLVSVSFGPEFAPSAYAQSYFQSCVISLYFVSAGEVCPGGSFAAM